MTPASHNAMHSSSQSLSPKTVLTASLMPNSFGDLTMLTAEEKQDWLRAYSPANLRYVAALRGYVPADQMAGYTYAQMNCGDGSVLIGLAASNPEGVFFGFDADASKLDAASKAAIEAGVDNVKFVQADSAALTEALQSGALKPAFNYVVANMMTLDEKAIAPTVTLAGSLLASGGICYIAYPVTAGRIESQSSYITTYKPGSNNTDMAQAAASAGQMVFAGSAKIKNNYMEFVVHPDQQPRLLEMAGQPVFESLKDFAIGGRMRHDMWVKAGAEQSDNLVSLLGGFSFGMSRPSSYIDPQFKYFDKKIDLTTPMFTRLLTILSETSHSIGDLIAHTEFANAQHDEIITGLQMLVAIGMVEPTRGMGSLIGRDFDKPQLAGSYNQRLRAGKISEEGALLAASMLGRPVLGTAPMVMTLQALDQGGLSGAEEILDQMLQSAEPAVKAMIGTDLIDAESRRNTAYRLLEQVTRDWLMFCYVNGIMQPGA